MAEEIKEMSESEKKKEDWMNSKWRPMMGWMYMAVCTSDFIVFPILWSIVQTLGHGQVNVQWQPITLQGAGLFHIAMGAVLGIAAMGRTQEKLAGANNGGAVGTTYTPPPPVPSVTTPSVAVPSFTAPAPVAQSYAPTITAPVGTPTNSKSPVPQSFPPI
jgi:hypothetical protein